MSGGEIFHLHFCYVTVLQIYNSHFFAKSGGGGENNNFFWEERGKCTVGIFMKINNEGMTVIDVAQKYLCIKYPKFKWIMQLIRTCRI